MLKLRSSVDEHTGQRNVRLLLSIATSVVSKFVGIGATLITIPLTLDYLGVESFGVWMVISGVIGFMGFTDLGIGMGLQNALSKAYGQDDIESPKHYISNAYLMVSGLASVLALITIGLFETLPMAGLFKIENQAVVQDAVTALKYSVLAFLLGMPLGLIGRILGGVQKTYIANNVMLVGSLVSLLAILAAVYLDLGLSGLAVLFILSGPFTMFLYSTYFYYKNSAYRPTFSFVSRKHVKPIVAAGIWTVFVQIIYTAKMNVPTMIISASLGLLAVAEYSVAQKLAGLAAAMISVALQPLWGVYGEAYSRGDREWICRTLKKSIILVVVLSVFAGILFQIIGQPLIKLWLGDAVMPSQMLILGFSLWMLASNINICFAMLLNGTGNFKKPGINSFCFVGLAILINFLFVDVIEVVGVVLVMFLFSEALRIPYNYHQANLIMKNKNG